MTGAEIVDDSPGLTAADIRAALAIAAARDRGTAVASGIAAE